MLQPRTICQYAKHCKLKFFAVLYEKDGVGGLLPRSLGMWSRNGEHDSQTPEPHVKLSLSGS
jgi:hypothetical protein